MVNDPAAPNNSSVRRIYDRGQFERAWQTQVQRHRLRRPRRRPPAAQPGPPTATGSRLVSPRPGESTDRSGPVAAVDVQLLPADEPGAVRRRGSRPPRRCRGRSRTGAAGCCRGRPRARGRRARRSRSAAAAIPSVSMPGPDAVRPDAVAPLLDRQRAHHRLDRRLGRRGQPVAHREARRWPRWSPRRCCPRRRAARASAGRTTLKKPARVLAELLGHRRRARRCSGASSARADRPRAPACAARRAARRTSATTRSQAAASAGVQLVRADASAVRRRPRRPAGLAASSSVRQVKATSLPRCASSRTTARPIPPLPPVTSAAPSQLGEVVHGVRLEWSRLRWTPSTPKNHSRRSTTAPRRR